MDTFHFGGSIWQITPVYRRTIRAFVEKKLAQQEKRHYSHRHRHRHRRPMLYTGLVITVASIKNGKRKQVMLLRELHPHATGAK